MVSMKTLHAGQELYPGEKIVFSGTGFVGMYVGGNHEYFIWERSANRMRYTCIGLMEIHGTEY